MTTKHNRESWQYYIDKNLQEYKNAENNLHSAKLRKETASVTVVSLSNELDKIKKKIIDYNKNLKTLQDSIDIENGNTELIKREKTNIEHALHEKTNIEHELQQANDEVDEADKNYRNVLKRFNNIFDIKFNPASKMLKDVTKNDIGKYITVCLRRKIIDDGNNKFKLEKDDSVYQVKSGDRIIYSYEQAGGRRRRGSRKTKSAKRRVRKTIRRKRV